MAGDDEFDHILENSQRVLKLNAQYENHPYVEEFTKRCSVMFIYGTYILEEEADAKFSLSEIWNLLQADSLPNNTSNLFRQMINCTRVWIYIQKTSDSLVNIEIIKQTHKIMMHKEKHRDGKDVLDIETRLHSQAIIFLHRLILLEDIWKTQFLGFMKLKKMIQSWPLQICFDTSIYIHLKMETEEFVP